jgi:hypothetical protein
MHCGAPKSRPHPLGGSHFSSGAQSWQRTLQSPSTCSGTQGTAPVLESAELSSTEVPAVSLVSVFEVELDDDGDEVSAAPVGSAVPVELASVPSPGASDGPHAATQPRTIATSDRVLCLGSDSSCRIDLVRSVIF